MQVDKNMNLLKSDENLKLKFEGPCLLSTRWTELCFYVNPKNMFYVNSVSDACFRQFHKTTYFVAPLGEPFWSKHISAPVPKRHLWKKNTIILKMRWLFENNNQTLVNEQNLEKMSVLVPKSHVLRKNVCLFDFVGVSPPHKNMFVFLRTGWRAPHNN